MNKTNVDEMLLVMIEPKIREIQERFSRGEGLGGDDINSLLLKSQFNHINHLDEKLNEITATVDSLKGEFNGLRGEFTGLKGEFKLLENRFDSLETKVDARLSAFEANMKAFESNIELKIQKAINSNMRWSIGLIAFLVTVLKLIDVLAAKLPNLF